MVRGVPKKERITRKGRQPTNHRVQAEGRDAYNISHEGVPCQLARFNLLGTLGSTCSVYWAVQICEQYAQHAAPTDEPSKMRTVVSHAENDGAAPNERERGSRVRVRQSGQPRRLLHDGIVGKDSTWHLRSTGAVEVNASFRASNCLNGYKPPYIVDTYTLLHTGVDIILAI